MVLVVVVVVGVAGFCVYRLHGIFGSHNNTSAAGGISDQTEPFSPKHITLEVFGNPGGGGDHQLRGHQCPAAAGAQRSPAVVVDHGDDPAGAFSNLVAQGNSDSLGCRITVDGDVKDERIVNQVNAYTFCLVKSA